MKFVYNDGGRSKYFKADKVGDCVTRAICNATGKDYKEVYDRLQELEKTLKLGKHEKQGTVRNGVRKKITSYYIEKELGWVRHCVNRHNNESLHLTEDELPEGTLIVQISKHITCVKDKVIYDTYNCSTREYNIYNKYADEYEMVVNNKRAVYAYWTAPTEEQAKEKQAADNLKAITLSYINECKKEQKIIRDQYNKEIYQHRLAIQKLQYHKSNELKKIKAKYAKELISDENLYN